MKEVWKVGDKSKAICESCKEVVSTTFKKKSKLVAICDNCHSIVGIPQQSFPVSKSLSNKKGK